MSISDDQWHIDLTREEADGAEADLRLKVAHFCPGDHRAVQHRDRQPPWCPHCGRTDRGERIKHVDQ